jgi:hypothetical protein
MRTARRHRQVDEALGSIEEAILPRLSLLIDTVLDSASLARPGHDAERYAAELRETARQVDGLTRLVAAVAPERRRAQPPARISV